MFLELIEKNAMSWLFNFLAVLFAVISFLASLLFQNLKGKIQHQEQGLEKLNAQFGKEKAHAQNQIHLLVVQQKAQEVEIHQVLQHLDRIESRLKEIHDELGAMMQKVFENLGGFSKK